MSRLKPDMLVPARVTGILGVLQDGLLSGEDQLAQPEESFQSASAIRRCFQSFSFENSGDIHEVWEPLLGARMGGEAIPMVWVVVVFDD